MHRNPQEPAYKSIPPTPIYIFRVTTPTDDCFLPELPKNRTCTDVWFLIVFLIYISIMAGLSCAIAGNKTLRQRVHRYDSCGNKCGINNSVVLQKAGCKPQDFRDFPFLLYRRDGKECIKVEDCKLPQRELYFRKCFPTDYDSPKFKKVAYKVFDSIAKSAFPMAVMFLCTAGLNILMYLCFWLNAYITCTALTFIATIFPAVTAVYSWYMFLVNHIGIFIIPSLLATFYLAALVLLLILMSDVYSLVVRFYVETSKAIFKEPIMLLQPAMSVTFVFALDITVIYLIVLLYFSESFEKLKLWYIFFLIIAASWMVFFINDCQYMIIAGTVAAHYFSRTRRCCSLLYLKSFWILVRYHLGTVAVGSLVMPILKMNKPVANFILRKKHKWCVKMSKSCCTWISEVSEYLSGKAYIITALHGRGIKPSGQRAGRLLWLFLCDMIAIDHLAYLTMYMIGALITLCSMVIAIAIMVDMKLEYEKTCLFVGLLISVTVTYFYVIVMTIVMQTLIVCSCEDRILNDGSRYQPYFMSLNLYNLMIEALELAYKENVHDDIST